MSTIPNTGIHIFSRNKIGEGWRSCPQDKQTKIIKTNKHKHKKMHASVFLKI
jgi:hypothetical protein